MTPLRPRFLVELEALPADGLNVPRRLARALKALLRSHGFRCVSARELPTVAEPDPGAAANAPPRPAK